MNKVKPIVFFPSSVRNADIFYEGMLQEFPEACASAPGQNNANEISAIILSERKISIEAKISYRDLIGCTPPAPTLGTPLQGLVADGLIRSQSMPPPPPFPRYVSARHREGHTKIFAI